MCDCENVFSPHLSSAKSRRFESCSSACVPKVPRVQFRESLKDSSHVLPSKDSVGHRTRTKCCCSKHDKHNKVYATDSADKKAPSRSEKPRGEISSMSGANLRSVVSSQIVMMNLLSESIARLNEYAEKVLHEDFSHDLSFMNRLLSDNVLPKDILQKMNYFVNMSRLEPKTKQVTKPEVNVEATKELVHEPQTKKKPKKEEKIKEKDGLKEEARGLAKSMLKGEPKWEPNGKPKEEPKGEPKEKLKSKTNSKQLTVESEIHNRVILPVMHRIQRSYLISMEEQLQLMTYLESMPSTLIDLLKNHANLSKEDNQ